MKSIKLALFLYSLSLSHTLSSGKKNKNKSRAEHNQSLIAEFSDSDADDIELLQTPVPNQSDLIYQPKNQQKNLGAIGCEENIIIQTATQAFKENNTKLNQAFYSNAGMTIYYATKRKKPKSTSPKEHSTKVLKNLNLAAWCLLNAEMFECAIDALRDSQAHIKYGTAEVELQLAERWATVSENMKAQNHTLTQIANNMEIKHIKNASKKFFKNNNYKAGSPLFWKAKRLEEAMVEYEGRGV